MKKHIKYLLFFLILFCSAQDNYLMANLCDRSGTIEEDSLQLVDMYNSLNGPSWFTIWDLSQPISSWNGITLNADQSAVLNIDLKNNNLSGVIPNIYLPELTELILSGNNITGEIPNFDLPSLKILWLHVNQLSGEIPDFTLPNMIHLSLKKNNLSGPIPNSDMPLLTYMNLSENYLVGPLPDFIYPELITLDLSDCSINGSIPDFDLPNIQVLDLSKNELTGTIPNFDLPALKNLQLNTNNLNGNLPNFNLPVIEKIFINKNELTGNIPSFNLPTLIELSLSGNQLSGSLPAFQLNNLEQLILSFNLLEETIPDFVAHPNLIELDLASNQFTGVIPNLSLDNLEKLNLSDNQLTGSIPNFNLANLEELRLGTNQLTGNIPLFTLPLLKELYLENNMLSGTLTDLADYPSLKRVYLSNNQFSGSIPIYSLNNIIVLVLGSNNLTGTIPILNLPNLIRLDLEYNNLTGVLPTFEGLPSMTNLALNNNQLSGEIHEFAGNPTLHSLTLGDNQFTGPFPNLESLTLWTFTANNNQLTGCYPLWLCDILDFSLGNVLVHDNDGLPDGGSETSLNQFCMNPGSQFGLPCDDGSPLTTGEVIQPDCSCSTISTLSNFIEGKIFIDTIENCTYDLNEIPIRNWLITAISPTATYYATPDSSGDFKLYTDTGNYVVHVEIPNNYNWEICPNIQDSLISFPTENDSLLLDIPTHIDFLCPVLSVDISVPILRRCFNNNYTLTYCNEGSALAENAYVEVTFDDFMNITGSTPPWTDQDGQTLTFEIGDLDLQECGSIQINVTPDCDSTSLGSTKCVEAHIFPDSICPAANSLWDGSTVELEGRCENDSLKFIIKNIGDQDMSMPLGYIVIEDDLILRSGSFQLPSGGVDSTSEASNGSTFRMEAEQAVYHPTISSPNVSIEGCVEGNGPANMGFVTIFSEDDAEPYISIDCQEIVGAYDPNDKHGYPAGLGPNHLITEETELEYHIRFQNTGTDTAFTVVIRDTLSEFLNPASIRMGASSHDYEWDILGTNTLELTFNNILLPDSNVNEVASHGFFKFKIDQFEGNEAGTLIENSAAIFFDFNLPIITNTATHMIEDRLIIYDTTYTAYCDHWFYENDTTLEIVSQFDYYDLYLINYIDIQSSNTSYLDSTLIAGMMYEGIIYENDTTIIHNLINSHGCDSIVEVSLSILTSIDRNDRNSQIQIYPNPTNSNAYLLFDLDRAMKTNHIELHNHIGQLVKYISMEYDYDSGKHVVPVLLDGFPKGVYLITLQGPELRWTQRIVLE